MKKTSRFSMLLMTTAFSLAFLLFAGFGITKASTDPVPTDYSIDDTWLHKPEITHEVDTFFIYPTAYTDVSEGAPIISDIYDINVRMKAISSYELQASVFEESTNVFVPYYRQINMGLITFSPPETRIALLHQEPKTDLFAALDYYFENLNDGRPFILAGYSQGSQLLTFILSEYREAHEDYFSRMVAAYVLGYSVTKNFLEENPGLKFAQGADDTGVIISWNTEGEHNRNQQSFVVEEGAIAINPLNWKLDETYAGKEENLGSLVFNSKTGTYWIVPGRADAVLDTKRGVVVTHTDAAKPVNPFVGFGPDSYHSSDYALWYNNIKENVKVRVERYLSDHFEQPGS